MGLCLLACGGPDQPYDQGIVEQPDTVLFYTVDEYAKVKEAVFTDTSVEITDPKRVVNGINKIYPQFKLALSSVSNDTVFTSVDNADQLTENIGSFGANEYLATVVINLTTLKNINFVSIDFRPGNHAMPGVYSKNNYQDYKEKNP